MASYKRIGITVKSSLSRKNASLKAIIDILHRCKCDVYLDRDRCGQHVSGKKIHCLDANNRIDLMVVIGGDGTLLRAVREHRDFSIPILSVNRGTVGFLTEVDMQEVADLIPKLLRGRGIIDKRHLLDVRVQREGKILFRGQALNEAVIAQGTIARLINVPTKVNGQTLTVFHADGLIVSTPTGSTAYSLASGGPIVHPDMQALILTPINPYSFSQKPIVIPGKSAVELMVTAKENTYVDTEVILTLDGQTYVSLKRGDTVSIASSKQSLKLLRRDEDRFFSTLRTKLKWGDVPGA